jgi:pantetheine-phosphate adenylyltransferase
METLFLTPAEQYTFISATMVREVARFGGNVGKFVSPTVVTRLRQKYQLAV